MVDLGRYVFGGGVMRCGECDQDWGSVGEDLGALLAVANRHEWEAHRPMADWELTRLTQPQEHE